VLLQSEVNGCPLSKEELFMFLLTLLVAGNETTRTLLSGLRWCSMSTRTSELHWPPTPRCIAGSDGGVPALGDPGPGVLPHGHRGCTVVGGRISEGDYLCMLYASGNRDARVFGQDADIYDVRRVANPMHVAFGFGEHVCLGASLARMEGRIFLEELLARYPNYTITGPAVRVASTTVAGIRTLPVVLAP
jgi:cytochrome P450